MAITLDASSPTAVTSSGATTTTAAFTPPNNSVLIACVSADANNGSTDETVSVSDSSSGTWNQAILQNANGGAVSAIFWRLCPTSIVGLTVSCTDNKGSVAKRLRVQVWTGTDQASPIGTTGQSTTAAVSYTSTVDQSQGVSCGITANATLTAGGSGNTLDDETGGFDSGDATFVLIKSTATTPAGSTVTLTIAGTSTIGHHVAVELVPPSSPTNFASPWTGPTPGRLGPTGQWSPQRLSAGQNFTASLAGTLAPAGALTKAAATAKAGTIGPAGAPAKQAQKALAGTETAAGAVAKQAQKALAGGETPTGALATIKVVLRSFAGSLTPAATLAKAAAKALSGSLTPAGAVAKAASKATAGALGPTGGLAKQARKALAAALAAAGALATQLGGAARRATSTSSVSARRTSTPAVADRRTSTPDVEG